jgi:poly(hydroxyalkanoate) depolymerase family esterase
MPDRIPLLKAADMKHMPPSGRLIEATAALQRMLGGHRAPTGATAGTKHALSAASKSGARIGRFPFSATTSSLQSTMPEELSGVLDRISNRGFQFPAGRQYQSTPIQARLVLPNGARFVDATFSNHAGNRPYKLYVPSSYRPGEPVPLVVMLHGCKQSPGDFAAGTCMNEAAEEHTCLVAYPGQTSVANMQKCWNWFNEGDQQRDRGEPSLIAGITREIMHKYAVDPRCVYVGGLSAGGAAAAIMGDAYPDLYAAIGVHSGLACGSARDMTSAFAAMQRGNDGCTHRAGRTLARIVPAIVFHGDRDTTVNPINGHAVVVQSGQTTALRPHVENGQVPGGHTFRRTLYKDTNGWTVIEQWIVHGAGHAWFGGSTAGTYTDPRGPDATREMLRFFREHPHPTATEGV